jgi:hypothetical protein
MAISNWFAFGKKVVENFRKVPAAPKKEAPGKTENPTFKKDNANVKPDAGFKYQG